MERLLPGIHKELRQRLPAPMAKWLPGDNRNAAATASGYARSDGAPPPRPTGNWPIFAALAVFAIAGLWWMLGGGKAVDGAVVRAGSAAEVVYATGVIEPVHWAQVTALQRKRIVEICKCEGEAVQAGDVLAKLDDAEERAVLTELEARLEKLRADAERTERLVQRNIAARVTLDEKLTQIDEQEARVAAQRDRISDLALKSPVDGVVLRRDGEVGEIAGTSANDTLLWVGQPKPLRVVAEINEDDILRVKPGQKVLLRHEGQLDRPMQATVDRITPKGDPDTKTFRAYFNLPDDTPLKIGMSVEANIVVAEVEDALLVPAEAVHANKVIRVTDGRAAITLVEIGIKGAGQIEIRSGLARGDVIVSPFDTSLQENASVRVNQTAGK